MRRHLDGTARGRALTLDLEGKALPALEGEPLACALIAAGEPGFSGCGPRAGAYCFSGACGQCCLRVDGVPGIYACRTPAGVGMRLQHGGGGAAPEPRDGASLGERVRTVAARDLGVLLPAGEVPELTVHEIKTRVAIAGGGAAGLAAAAELGARGVPFLLFEREARIGGRLRRGAPEPGAPPVLDPGTLPCSALRRSSAVMAVAEDAAGRHLLVLSLEVEGLRLTRVYAERFLLAVGGVPAQLDFEGSRLPGVYAGRAASLLVREHGMWPASAALVGWGPELTALAQLLTAQDCHVRAVVGLRGPAGSGARPGREPAAHGAQQVSAFSFTAEGGERVRVECEAVIVSLPPAPRLELARQGGARLAESSDAVLADGDGRTQAEDLFVAGDLAGALEASAAAESGQRAAVAISGDLR